MLRNSSQILCRDAASRLTAMLASNGDRVNFIFDAGGRLRESSIPDGLKAQYSYDAGDNLRKRINRTSQGIVSQHNYTYDAVGRRDTYTEAIDGAVTDYSYDYDSLDRIIDVWRDGGGTINYSNSGISIWSEFAGNR